MMPITSGKGKSPTLRGRDHPLARGWPLPGRESPDAHPSLSSLTSAVSPMPPFPLSLTRPARKQRWVHVLAVAVTTACIGADLAQADPLFENAAEGVGSVAEILLPAETESVDDVATVVDWIEKLPAWTDEPVAEDVDAF